MGNLAKEEVLKLLNEFLYAYVYANNKKEEKKYCKEIKKLRKILKLMYNAKIKFDKEELKFVFK